MPVTWWHVNHLWNYWVLPNSRSRVATVKVHSFFSPCLCSLSLPPCAAWPLDLPEVVMDGQGVHTDWHSLGWDDGELFAIRAVFVELVNHLPTDGAWASAGELDDLLGFWWERVNGAKLTPAVTEEDHQVVGLTLVQLLSTVKQQQNLNCRILKRLLRKATTWVISSRDKFTFVWHRHKLYWLTQACNQ